MRRRRTLILGGARSGKSRLALQLGERIEGKRLFLATCPPLDPEMRDRIARHQRDRGSSWDTIEAFYDLDRVILKTEGRYDVVLIDCLTLWLSNRVMENQEEAQIRNEILGLKGAIRRSMAHLFLVSNEVGMGVVPSSRLGRDFRDLQGFLNQEMAAVAEEVYLTIAGIPVRMKPA